MVGTDEEEIRDMFDLTLAYGKGFSRSNVAQIRQFYLRFPKIQTLSGQLSWSHYVEILKAEDELAIQFYAKQCEKESWSVRELKRQMKSCLNEISSTSSSGVLCFLLFCLRIDTETRTSRLGGFPGRDEKLIFQKT